MFQLYINNFLIIVMNHLLNQNQSKLPFQLNNDETS